MHFYVEVALVYTHIQNTNNLIMSPISTKLVNRESGEFALSGL